jgi:hypothetical protein
MTRDEIATYAESWLGTRWVHQGRTKNGIDCVGLLIKIAEHFNVPHEDKLDYARTPVGFEFLDQVRKYLPRAPIGGNRHGYVGIFNENIFPCHTGIIVVKGGHEYLIHATARQRETVEEHLGNSGLRLIECRVFPGMED